MTKNEFIQEAALRLTTAWAGAGSFTTESVATAAQALADDVWAILSADEQPEQTEAPEVLPYSDKVQVVAKEIARLEREAIDRKNAEYKEKGWFCHYQKSGADIRFLNVCYDTSRGQSRIETVKDILNYGRRDFERRRNMGHLTMELLDKALENLYNIKSW